MNIKQNQLQAIRRLLTKDDKFNIALHTGKSTRTIDAVLQGDRVNNEIEERIVIAARQNISHYLNILADIEANNIVKVSTEEYRKATKNAALAEDSYYNRYVSIYLSLANYKITDLEELWEKIWNTAKDIIARPYFCIHLLQTLTGVEDTVAVKFFNRQVSLQG